MLVGIRNAHGCEMRELTSSDDEGWQEREASRTHSVKFTDEPPEADKEVDLFNPIYFISLFKILVYFVILCHLTFLIISSYRLHLYVKTHHIQKS